MTQAKLRFSHFDEYLAATEGLLEGRYEYVDGELVPVMTESGENDDIVNYLFLMLVNAGIPFKLIKPGRCEVEVAGKPRTRFPDLVVLREQHIVLPERRNTITRQMPPPQIIVEVVSPGKENRERDCVDKRRQYSEIGVPEYWLVDPEYQTVTVLQLQDSQYIEYGMFQGAQSISSPAFSTLPFTATQILSAGQY